MTDEKHCNCLRRMATRGSSAAAADMGHDFALLWFDEYDIPTQYTQHLLLTTCVECGQKFYIGNIHQLFIGPKDKSVRG